LNEYTDGALKTESGRKFQHGTTRVKKLLSKLFVEGAAKASLPPPERVLVGLDEGGRYDLGM
jgi:hypothetical protein